jgi:hypothetical protein
MANNDANLELSLRNFLSSGPKDDDAVHAYAEKLGINPHEFEGKIYNIAFKALSGAYLKHADDDDSQFDADQLKRGIEVEKEHTDDEAIAKTIAKAHLSEFPDYYTRLADMEDQAKQSSKQNDQSSTTTNTEGKEMRNFIEAKDFPILSALLIEAAPFNLNSNDLSAHKDHDWDQTSAKQHLHLAKFHHERAREALRGDKTYDSDPAWAKKHRAVAKFHKKMGDYKNWFDSLSDEQKNKYKGLHPHSKLEAKNFPILSGLLRENNEKKEAPTKPEINIHKKHDWSGWSAEDHKNLGDKYMASAKKNLAHPGYEFQGKAQKEVADFHHGIAKAKNWFSSLSDEQKKQYKELHPHSKLS